ncbi:O-antigen ligase family protein [Larkinella soli]|uniref:O-antigen ligase family protein n=1 Tax=Larkinella soli TaxID=1770527 RepID=UPI000FFB380D|nr:O-antigen ligase family protein [Larkinella soli]
MKIVKECDSYLARFIMVSFFIPHRLQLLSFIVICLFWIIRDTYKRQGVRFRPYGWALLLGSVFLLYAAWLPFSPDEFRQNLLFKLEKRASLFIMPFALLFLNPQTRKTLSRELIYFVYGCLGACLVGNLCYLLKFGRHPGGPDSHVQYRLYFEEILDIHPTYMGIYLCFSAAILLMTPAGVPSLKGWKLGAVLFPLFIFLMALMPKAPVIALVVVLAYYGWTFRLQRKVWAPIVGVLVLAVSVACVSIPFSGQRISEISSLLHPSENPATNSIQMRQMIWEIDLRLLADHWLTGVGPSNLDRMLAAQYELYSRLYNFPFQTYNTHNEYLNLWLSFGLCGLLLFLAVLTVQFVRAMRWQNRLYVSLLLILSITFFTENVLARQQGIVFYAFFSSLFFLNGLYRERTSGFVEFKRQPVRVLEESELAAGV